jgi:sulfotransferase family protein
VMQMTRADIYRSFLPLPSRSEDLIERAQRHAGLSEFGDAPFEAGLRVFLRACTEEADLSLFGNFATRWDIRRLLSNLLRLHYEEQQAPEILQERIDRPIFITGLPRSGTTFLHQLLAVDPSNQVPRVWQLIHPYRALGQLADKDTRQRRVARHLRFFKLLAPDFRRMHPINADSPQECSEITAHIFASLRFDTTYCIPSYRRWLDSTGHLNAFRFHKRFLQHLQHQTGTSGRWVLKCPDHVFALAEIRAVYPNARIVFVHRDPLRVLGSLTRLTEVLRRPFTKHLDRAQLGPQECERWSRAADLMLHATEHEPFAEPICHICYHDLVRDPVGSVERLYDHFGLTPRPDFATLISSTGAANPNGGSPRRYRLEDYAIDPGAMRKRFAHYVERFGTLPETEPVITKSPALPLLRSDRVDASTTA